MKCCDVEGVLRGSVGTSVDGWMSGTGDWHNWLVVTLSEDFRKEITLMASFFVYCILYFFLLDLRLDRVSNRLQNRQQQKRFIHLL